MRRFKRSKKQFFIGIISSVILVLTIGYSFLSLNLRVLGLAHIGAVWNIHFDNITINPDSASLSAGDIEPEIDEDNDCKINYKVTLTPGDFYEFNFDIVNEGTIDGMIQNIITRIEEDATATLPSYINYSVSYEDDVVLETNQQLLAGTTETLKVKVEFKDEENVPESETLDLSYESNYVKKTSSATKVNHPQPLYNVLQDEANSGSGLAVQYTGEHHDSFTEEPSKNIYHWYASNATNGTTILDKNNVIFANHCWQMYRTTDTGGVKLLYNGEPDNNQCLNNRGNHLGYSGRTALNLNDYYWYGTDYTYDSTNKVFSISGTTEQALWSDSTYSGLIGKYSCKSTTENGTCATLYIVDSYLDSTKAYAVSLASNSNYSQFGILGYSSNSSSLSSVGYMVGDTYVSNVIDTLETIDLKKTQYVLNTEQYAGFLGYGDDVVYDETTGMYTLVNFTTTTPSDLTGKYISNYNNLPTSSVVYMVKGPGLSVRLQGGKLLSDYNTFIVGESITDNLDGTYSLNSTSSLTLLEVAENNNGFVHKYTCNGSKTTCAYPKYVTYSNSSFYYYIDVAEKIMIGKSYTGTTLTDTLLVSKLDLVLNSDNYSAYKYTCSTDNANCTEQTLRIINSFTSTGYKYNTNHYYGSSVIWDGTNYTLVDPVGIENYNNPNNLNTYRFMCLDIGLKSCSTVVYIHYYLDSGKYVGITLSDGISSINQVLDNMLKQNKEDSLIKKGVDEWYKRYLYDNFDQYVEDTIFCNDRTISSYGSWLESGGSITDSLKFKEYNNSQNLSCANVKDQFSSFNSSAQLSYKVGILFSPEVNLLGNQTLLKTGFSYWTSSPYSFSSNYSRIHYVTFNGKLSCDSPGAVFGVRPVVSLRPGIKYSGGDGSMANPYIIKLD